MRTRRPEGTACESPESVAAHSESANDWCGRGDALADRTEFEEAIASYRRALQLDPAYSLALLNLGVALQQLFRHEEALNCYQKVLALEVDHPRALANQGIALLALSRLAEARTSLAHALAADPANPEAHFNLGFVLHEMGNHAEALASYERALEIRPDDPATLSNRGIVLQYLRQYDEALASYDRALSIDPNSVEAQSNRGSVLQDLGRYEEALAGYARAQAIQPDYPDAHWNESLCRLRLGDFEGGWQKYEWRWKSGQKGQQRDFAQALWLGQLPLDGKTIFLHAEQGVGDTLQFCRYAQNVAALGARVILEVQPPLREVLADLKGVHRLVVQGERLPEFDYHCPLLSLPLAFATQIQTIPATHAYLRSDPARVARWQRVLGARTMPRVGLIWSGRPDQMNDHNRSIPLAEFATLLDCGVQLVGLQKDIRAADQDFLDAHSEILSFAEDFAETAALIELMDVVVSVDTSIAHLAGALGKPVWLLLPRNPEWRWLLGREDSPWYPSARLFRQKTMGDWGDVIAAVREALDSEDGIRPPDVVKAVQGD